MTGQAPSGWYCRYGPSENTRDLVVEHGGFLYDSNSYADDLPYYTTVQTPSGERPWLVVPYSLTVNDSKFWDWYNEIKLNTIARRAVVVSLLDETGTPKRTWTLNNAWPTKITGTDLKSEGNEVAVESVEIAYETLTVAAP